MDSNLIVTRTTAVGALCLAGAVGSCVGFQRFGAWLPFAVALVGTAVMWALGRTLREQVAESERLEEVARSHTARAQEHTEIARAMAASLAERALSRSREIRGDAESIRVAEISAANHTLAGRILDEAAGLTEKLEHALAEVDRVTAAAAQAEEASRRSADATRRIGQAADEANRLAVSATVELARGRKPGGGHPAVAQAVRELTELCRAAADGHASVAEALADCRGDDDAMRALQGSFARLLEALGTLREGLEVVKASTVINSDVADALAELCVDARFIDRELGTMQYDDSDDDLEPVDLAPMQPAPDRPGEPERAGEAGQPGEAQSDAEGWIDVHAAGETGNMHAR